jgi:hypothetical protein
MALQDIEGAVGGVSFQSVELTEAQILKVEEMRNKVATRKSHNLCMCLSLSWIVLLSQVYE